VWSAQLDVPRADFHAVHSMKRASYGTAQSLGCVELPLSEAQQAYLYLTYGSLVTVTGAAPEQQS
jgi:hypothetical protein